MAAIWVGIDDSDAPGSGCTTWALTELIRVARNRSVDLIGPPRLVRLNPNAPWRTRGNAALAARFGHGSGRRWTVGEIDGAPVLARSGYRPLLAEERSALVEDLWSRLRAVAPRVRRTDPALVASERPLPARLYWDAVRTIVPIRPVVEALDRWGVTYRHRGSLRGLIGASAALAWPSRRVTWELLAYRAPDRWGSPRRVSRSSVRAAQRKVPELFLCDDPRTRRLLIAPHTACPILYGLRGTTPAAPLAGQALVRSEPVDRWMLFRTNQATGDHLVRRAANRIAPYESAVVEGTVCADPVASPGGHVRFELQDRGGASLTCLAFEPTKVLPKVARGLRVGDRVRVWGSRGKAQGLRLEGIRLVRLPLRTSLTKPHCGRCDRPARSLGRSRGYWCPGCHRRWPPEAAQRVAVPAPFPVGEYHPTPSARRHLHPLAPEA